MDYSLSNAELVLLLMISEQPGINGYGIRRLVEERGLTAWAGVSSSSIYNGLRRVERRGLVRSALDTGKTDRGPRGQALRVTAAGRRALKKAVSHGLASSREHDPRFNIALSGLDELGHIDAAERLQERADFLAGEARRLRGVRESNVAVPLPAELLFDRILHAIEAERAWTLEAAQRVARTAMAAEEVAAP